MKKRSDNPEDLDRLREKIIGLGERSVRKSYYPKLQQQLQELELLTRRHKLILEHAAEGIFGLDLQGNYTFINKAAAGMLGYEPAELIGKHSHSCIHYVRPDGAPYPEDECRTYAAFRSGTTRHVDDECFCRKDGSTFPVEYTSTPIREHGEITGAVVTFSDITERKRSEAALKESEWRLEFATSVANEAIWDWDLATDRIIRNEVYAKNFGRPPEGSDSVEWWTSRIHPEDRERVASAFAAIFDSKQDDVNVEYRFLLVDGSWGIVHDRAKVIRNSRGEAVRIVGTMLNITERKQAENRIRESETNLRIILDSVYDAVFIHNLDGTIVDVNRKMLELYRVDRERALRSTIIENFSAPDNPFEKVPDIWAKAIAGENQLFEWKARRPDDGSVFDIEVFLRKITFQSQELILANVRDISARKQAEQQLKKVSRQYELLLKSAGEGIMGLDNQGHVTFINQAAADMLGYGLDELIGKHSHSTWHYKRPDGSPYPVNECPMYTAYKDKIVHFGEDVFWRKDGTAFPIDFKSIPLEENGNVGAVITFRDITERKRAEEALRTSEKNYREIFDSVNDAIFVHDIKTGEVLSINSKATDMFGFGLEEFRNFIDDTLFTGLPGYTAQDAMKLIRQAAEGPPQLFEWLSRRKNGELFWVEVNLKRAVIGGETRLLAVVRDITERKKIEQEIRKTKEQLVEAQHIAGIGNWEWDVRTNTVTWSDEVYRIFNIPLGEFKGTFTAVMEMVHPEDRAGIEKTLAEAANERKETAVNEYRIIRPDGAIRIIHTQIRLEYNSAGEVVSMRGTAQDVTDARRAEETLKLTQFSMDHASVSAFIIARDARILYANEQACRGLGYSREELLSMTIPDLDPDFPQSRWDKHWDQLKKEGALHFESIHRRKDGALIPMDISVNYLSFGGREYNIAFTRDVTERKKADQELVRLNRQKELILESAGDGIFGMDDSGNHILTNSAGARMLGYTPDELMGRYSHTLWHHTRADGSPYPGDECLIYKTRHDGISRHVDDEVFWKKDGTSIPVEYMTTPIREGDTITGCVVSFRDITERKRSEEALRISESRFRNLFKQSSISMQIFSPDGRTLEVNRAWEELWGLKRDALKDYNILQDEQLTAKGVMPYIQKGFAGEATEIPVTGYNPSESGHNGHARWVKAFIYPVKTRAGRIHQVVLMHWDVTDMVEAEEALRESEERFRAFFESAGVGTAQLDPSSGKFARVNQEFCRMTGYSADELRSMTFTDLTHPEDRAVDAAKFAETLRPGSPMFETEKRYVRKDGRIIWVHVSATVVRDSRGKPVHTAGIIQDITARKLAEEALRQSEQFIRRVLDNLIAFVGVLTPAGVLIDVNRSALIAGGVSPQDVLGKPFADTYWFSWSPELQARVRVAIRKGAAGETSRFDIDSRVAGDQRMPLDFMLAPISDEQGRITHLIASAIEITERKRMEQEIRHMAHHDSLTGLPNRRLFNDIAGIELAQAERNKTKLALLFLDLDRFKEINDTLGHASGDLLLKEVASRLKTLLRKSDSIGRIGGDEFNIILADIGRPEDVADIARKIVNSFRKPYTIAGQDLHVTTSIGISIFPDDCNELEGLLRYSDMAMYHAKEQGRNAYQFYDASINIRSIERIKLENMLRRSLEMGEMAVYYQPQVNIATGKIICAEALVRWRHPDKGLLLPKDFMQSAEETGFITEIDDWVLWAVCRQIKSWREAGLPLACVTVNLSARQFQSSDLPHKIESILKKTGAPPSSLDIEITESMAMSDVERSAGLMRKLADMGIHISIDDFGTGYSSLNYLKRMPIEKLKIDRSFIKDISVDRDDREIIHAVTAMAHNMHLKVIAEGVETIEQLSFLRSSDCDEAQGFLFSQALPAEEFRELVTAGSGSE